MSFISAAVAFWNGLENLVGDQKFSFSALMRVRSDSVGLVEQIQTEKSSPALSPNHSLIKREKKEIGQFCSNNH